MQCIHYLTAAGFIFADKIPCNHELSDNKYSWMITFTHFYTFLLCSYRIHGFYKFVETESLEPPRPYLGITAPEPTVTLIKLGWVSFTEFWNWEHVVRWSNTRSAIHQTENQLLIQASLIITLDTEFIMEQKLYHQSRTRRNWFHSYEHVYKHARAGVPRLSCYGAVIIIQAWQHRSSPWQG